MDSEKVHNHMDELIKEINGLQSQLIEKDKEIEYNQLRLLDSLEINGKLKQEIKELRGKNFMPDFLTAENGAKALLSGEFKEKFEAVDEDFQPYTAEIVIEWTTIKDIYRKIHNHFLTN